MSNVTYKSNELERILQAHKNNQNNKPIIEKPKKNLFEILNSTNDTTYKENYDLINDEKNKKIKYNESINESINEDNNDINLNKRENYNEEKEEKEQFLNKNFTFKRDSTGFFGQKDKNKNSSSNSNYDSNKNKNNLAFQSFGKNPINNSNQSPDNKISNNSNYEYNTSNKDKDDFLKFSFKINSELPESEFNDINYLD